MKALLYVFLMTITAGFVSCDKPNEQSVAPDDIIKLEAVSDISNLSADGTSLVTFKATIAHETSSDGKDVTLTLSDTNLGKFTGTSTANKQTLKSNADGVVTSSFKLGTIPGNYSIAAEVKVGDNIYRSKDIAVILQPLATSAKIQVVPDNLSPSADAVSLVNFQVNSLFSQDKKVTVTSNTGTLIGSADPKLLNLVLDDQGKASFSFRVTNEIVPHILTAKITDGSFVTITLAPKLSYTDTLLLEPSGLLVDTVGGFIQLSSFLRKFNTAAKVTKGTQVFFNAYQLISGVPKAVGRFTGIAQAVSDADGVVPPVKFFADTRNIVFALPVYIEVSAFKSATDKVVVTLPVTLK